MSQHLILAPEPGRQSRDRSWNQGASSGSGSGGGAADAARATERTAAPPLQQSAAPSRAGERRRIVRGLKFLPSPPSGAERAGRGGGCSARAARPTSPSRRFASGPFLSALKGGEEAIGHDEKVDA